MAESKTLDLYLKIMQPGGMKFSPIDPLTNKVNKKITVLIFPEKPTAVEKNLAKLLIEQNDHLLSTDPYTEENDIRVQTVNEAKKRANEMEAARTMETTEERRQANARFVKASSNAKIRQFQKVRPSHDPGLMYGGDRNAVDDKGKDLNDKDVMKYVEPLSEFMEMDREKCTREQLRHFAKILDLKLDRKKSSVKTILPALESHAEKLTRRIKAVMDRTKKADASGAAKIAKAESSLPLPLHGSGLLPETSENEFAEEKQQKEAEELAALEETTAAETPKK